MNKIFTLLIVLLAVNFATAQRHICGVTTEDQMGMIEFIEHLNKNPQAITRSEDPIYIPVKIHMTARNDGSGRVKAANVLSQCDVLFEDFKKLGIYLYLQDAEPNYLNSTSIYLNPGNFVNTIISNKDSDAVNVFVCENANPPGSDDDAGVVLGFYNPQGDYIIMRNNDVQNATSSLSHEMGHLFDLPHTFFGWENVYGFYGWAGPQGVDPWDVDQFGGMYTENTAGGSNVIAEVQDMSNCTIAADRICDTPPDYNFGFGADGCFWPNTLRDRNGDVIDPQENNFMSYFGECDPYEFTEGQLNVMIANINSSDRDHLDKDYVPDTTVITSNHELLSPTEGEVLDFYNKILLDWSDADGASNYLVTLNSQTGETTEFFVKEESELFIEELDPNSFYVWNVRPFNEGYMNTQVKEGFFRTGTDLDTSVKESELINNVSVYPNPMNAGQNINVSFNLERSLNVTMSLIDITGRVIMTNSTSMTRGQNNVHLEPVFESGVYILKMDTEDGSIHKKVVIR